MLYFEDFQPGLVLTVDETYELTEEEIIEVGRRWDPQPFHTDPDAAGDSIFGGLVASSVHLFAASSHLGLKLPEPVAIAAALGFDEVRWHHPARPGDSLSFRLITISTRPSSSRPECGILSTRSEIHNQNGELVFSYASASLIFRRPTQSESATRS